jgi:hypothetical protein
MVAIELVLSFICVSKFSSSANPASLVPRSFTRLEPLCGQQVHCVARSLRALLDVRAPATTRPSEQQCVRTFCTQAKESLPHLLLTCVFSREVWHLYVKLRAWWITNQKRTPKPCTRVLTLCTGVQRWPFSHEPDAIVQLR